VPSAATVTALAVAHSEITEGRQAVRAAPELRRRHVHAGLVGLCRRGHEDRSLWNEKSHDGGDHADPLKDAIPNQEHLVRRLSVATNPTYPARRSFREVEPWAGNRNIQMVIGRKAALGSNDHRWDVGCTESRQSRGDERQIRTQIPGLFGSGCVTGAGCVVMTVLFCACAVVPRPAVAATTRAT